LVWEMGAHDLYCPCSDYRNNIVIDKIGGCDDGT
jgi:hypothetical protein